MGPYNAGPSTGSPTSALSLCQCCPVLRSKWSLQRNSTTLMTPKAWKSPLRPGERSDGDPVRGQARDQVKD